MNELSMNEASRKLLYTKPIKALLIFLEILAVTVCCAAGYLFFYAESRGYHLFRGVSTYEESNEFFNQMQYTLERISHEAAENKNGDVNFPTLQEGTTNLRFFLALPEEQKLYSNTGKFQTYAAHRTYETAIKKEKCYTIVTESTFSSNGMKEHDPWFFQQQILEILGNHPFIFAAYVDTDYPIPDNFSMGHQQFMQIVPWIRPAFFAGVLCALLALACLILITIASGRGNEDNGIHLNRFDHWYTEFSAFLVFFLWVVTWFPLAEEYFSYAETLEAIVIGMAATGFWTACCFLLGYLSLVRRIKAKTLWKDSLLRKVFSFMKKLWIKNSEKPLRLVKRIGNGGKKAGSFGYRLLREGFLDNMSDFAKLCLVSVLLFLLHMFLMVVISWESEGFTIPLQAVLDILVILGILFYLAAEIRIKKALKKIASGELETKIDEKNLMGYQKEMAQSVNQIGDGMRNAVQESIRNERMKTELITNVSHDIKTPLTSIINYVDLLKRENIEDEKIQGYIQVLEEKAQRLKILTEDVVEASKASTGNISLEMTSLDFVELVQQAAGEYEEKFRNSQLTTVCSLPELPLYIYADGRRMWRILSNVFGNAAKYSLEGTRVYIDLMEKEQKAVLFIKNISRDPLNISADELTERFVRGDQSRSTEGSGLGLSIAKSFTELMGGTFTLSLDGDLFKVTITFPLKNQ